MSAARVRHLQTSIVLDETIGRFYDYSFMKWNTDHNKPDK